LKESIENSQFSTLPENSVLVVTSKIVSYCQNRLLAKQKSEEVGFSKEETRAEKHQIVRKEADYFLEPHSSKYNLMLTIKDQSLAVNAGLDESNAQMEDGREAFVLWPADLQETANQIWQFLREEFSVKNLGIIITDSRSIFLRWGVVGMAIASCGFKPLNDQRGVKDIFGREIHMVQENVAEALATAAVFEMGEVAEVQPLALVTEAKKVKFMDRPLNEAELAALSIEIEDDMYGPLLTAVDWQRGGAGQFYQNLGKSEKVEK